MLAKKKKEGKKIINIKIAAMNHESYTKRYYKREA